MNRDRQVAGEHCLVLIGIQRAGVGRKRLGQHRHHPVGEVNTVPPFARLAVDCAAGPHVEAHVRDGHDRLEPTRVAGVIVRRRPHRVVVVARVSGVDGEQRQVAQAELLGQIGLGTKHVARLQLTGKKRGTNLRDNLARQRHATRRSKSAEINCQVITPETATIF